MATVSPTLPTVQGAAVTPTAVGSSDVIPVQAGARYVLSVRNGNASADTVVIADPNSVSPPGATAFNSAVTLSVPAGTERSFLLDSNRFRDSGSGNITVTHSVTATVTAVVYGPL